MDLISFSIFRGDHFFMWEILDTGMASAEVNMRLDGELLSKVSTRKNPVLRLYSWHGDSATHGYFIEPEKFLNSEAIKERGLNLARRPTGGGIIFHLCDLAFSVIVPSTDSRFSQNTLANYAFINSFVATVVKKFLGKETKMDILPFDSKELDKSSTHFCMARPTKYDVMVDGKKVGGAAQRKTRDGFLHQGTISIGMMPQDFLDDILLPGSRVSESIEQNSFSLIGSDWTPMQLFKVRKEVRRLLVQSFLDEEI
ncbi:MAG: lipoate-protein ligase A [Chlamydiales bacterium]